MARSQTYFGPNDEANQLSTTAYVEITNADTASIAIAVLNGKIEYRGSSGAAPAASARGVPMTEGDVMIRRALSDLFADASITRVFVRAIDFQSEILVDATDA